MSALLKSVLFFSLAFSSIQAFAASRLQLMDQATDDVAELANQGKISPAFAQDASSMILMLNENNAGNILHVDAPTLPADNLMVSNIDPASGKIQSFKFITLGNGTARAPQANRGVAIFKKMSAYIQKQASLGDKDFAHMNENFREYGISSYGANESVALFTDYGCDKTIIFRLNANGDIVSAQHDHCD